MARKPSIKRPLSLPEQILRDGALIIDEIDTESTKIAPVAIGPIRTRRYQAVWNRLSYSMSNRLDLVPLAMRKELSHRDVFAWVPVFLALGIITYFSLPREPDGFGLAVLLALLAFVCWRARRVHVIFITSVSVFLLVGGAMLAKLETERLSTPLLKYSGTFEISGRVTELVPSDKRTRVVLRDVKHQHQSPEALAGVQLSAFNQHIIGLKIGDFVQVRARLEPMSGPLIPDGYDFRRAGYFKGLSARGFLLGEAVPFLEFSDQQGPSLTDQLNRLRSYISERISEALPGQGGALASALLVGQRAGIAEEVQEALRSSGLAHILAISGLHMALITSLIFGFVRILGALASDFSARHDVKKIAAATALMGAMIYLALSGSAISAQRAFLMASVFLIAILFDRAALTMRNVALSALVILFVQPSALLSPGFQMSFMAVIALVAVYRREGLFAQFKRHFSNRNLIAKMTVGILGLLLTSVIAGVATSPFAIHHFYQTAIYGVLGNLAAMPVVGLIVMPMGILSLVLMPFGLEQIPLSAMEFGLDYVVAVSSWVASIEGSVVVSGQQPALVTLLISLCILSVCLLRTKLRFVFAGGLGLLASLVHFSENSAPLILISPDGKMVASKGTYGLTLHSASKNKFTTGIWMRAIGDNRPVEQILDQTPSNSSCDSAACSFSIQTSAQDETRFTIIRRAESWFEACQESSDIVISSLKLPRSCQESLSFADTILLDSETMLTTGAIRLDALSDHEKPDDEKRDMLSAKFATLGLELKTALPVYKRPWN